MCPSDIFQLPVSDYGFGPGSEVFASDSHYPCSIAIKETDLADKVRIQVQRDDTSIWNDYEEGELLIGKKIKCRLAYGGETRKITIEVFHT
ncbi:MAG: hypothetical protein K9J17_06455 [Flavobacteriales bacterium]|nr:hypothetical protein [Flavobacteriales bacterium]